MKDFIKVYDNVVDLDVCARLCDRYNEHEQRPFMRLVRPVTLGHDENISNVLEGDGKSTINTALRSGSNMNCSIAPISIVDPYLDTLITKAYKSIITGPIDDYVNNHTEGYLKKDIWYWRFKQIDMLKYPKGQGYYKEHIDTDHKDTLPRFLTVITYLNDVEEGGETTFRWYDKIVKPKAGRTVIFPAMWTYPHTSERVISGDKHAMIMWGETLPTDSANEILGKTVV